MIQFKSFDPAIEVSGKAMLSVIDGMGIFKNIGIEILKRHGIHDVNPYKWYSQQAWLDSFKEIYETIGEATLVKIGESVPYNAAWPENIKNLEDALYAINVSFHLNHRKNGKILYDADNNIFFQGIGEYIIEKNNDKDFLVICKNSYPCDFDRGIITGTVKKYKPEELSMDDIKIMHLDGKCRKKGDDLCVYNVICK